jgi:hypothetical protein
VSTFLNSEINKWVLSSCFKVLNINLTSLHTGQFHFKEIFPVAYPYVSEELVLPLVREFAINWLVLDTTHVQDYTTFLEKGKNSLKEEMAMGRYRLLRVC